MAERMINAAIEMAKETYTWLNTGSLLYVNTGYAQNVMGFTFSDSTKLAANMVAVLVDSDNTM